MKSAPTPTKSHTFAHLSGVLAGAAQYLRARLRLLMLEGKDAGMKYGVALALVLAALFVAVLGYVFLVITAVFGIAAAWDWDHAWIVVLGAAALLHLGGAVALVFVARGKIKGGAFEATIEELKKDNEWLTQLTKRS